MFASPPPPPEPSVSRASLTESASAWLLLSGALSAIVTLTRGLGLPVVDDAAISIAYGLTFWRGDGLRLTSLSPPVEGFSSPLWTIISGLAGPLSVPPLEFAQWLGVALGALGILALSLWSPLAMKRRLRLEDLAPSAVALACASLPFWLASGMETGLHVFLLGVGGLGVILAVRKNWGVVGATLLGALAMVRPETLLVSGGMAAWWWFGRRERGERPSGADLRGAAVFALVVVAGLLARWSYYADLLPNTFYAKRTWDFGGLEYLRQFALTYPWLLTSAFVAAVTGLVLPRSRPVVLLALVPLLTTVVFVLKAHGDWMREWRFIAPAVTVLGVPVASALSAIREEWNESGAGAILTHREAGQVSLFILAPLVVAVHLQVWRLEESKPGPEFAATIVEDSARQLKVTMDGVGARHPLLALPDVGGLALAFPAGEIMDSAGLADYALAHAAPGYAAMQDYMVNEGPPLIVDAHGPSGHVAFPKLKPYFAGWTSWVGTLSGLTREDDPRCPGQKPRLMSEGAPAVQELVSRAFDEGRPVDALRSWRCAITYLDEPQLPSREWRQAMIQASDTRSAQLEDDNTELALRYASLATVMADGDAHRRRRTEQLRHRVFPMDAKL